jgi:transcriptional regulator with XRE-family HTH domain
LFVQPAIYKLPVGIIKNTSIETNRHLSYNIITKIFEFNINYEVFILADNFISKNIAELRRKKGVTQETLAEVVGISAQAVSKWESGGLPDIELLPAIADYFGISIDELFGRSVFSDSRAETATAKYISSIQPDLKITKAFEHCWTLERSLFDMSEPDEHTSLSAIRDKEKEAFSQMRSDNGITLMSLSKTLPYFLIMPEPENGWSGELYKTEDYMKFFGMLADRDVLKVLFLLYSRDNKPFTPRLLEKELQIKAEDGVKILERLTEYHLITTSEIELDDEIEVVYNFDPNPAFIALLSFSKEMIINPNCFYYYSGGRTKPYLQKIK